ncbi:adenylosuccinate lyase [Chloracidobacterium aggregatum]|uniref:Adenylosuccinate lyase n=1 Tax=Chloracidobacterium sp. N TaxID=2821540 RepID=A0ABX8AXC0_9BACT|nr:adenylosuccinate lyase [Chloracidobacterium aggregatum]QUV84671.1 adenylosuccinate lyase [Chloracidobacterium sp. 2]QUV86825.1 adenylosuccinate lyase [Chloracidobacterium sp. S]QUV91823.1 adenylosuccinate lyase [Chloracidobacterium sp. A]QUV92957.1 adenylosuccinate lyase [Chloracidobacterium sp. N]QUV96111.1 adenylosuccinate lyase [Chloracidobacterium sp. E]
MIPRYALPEMTALWSDERRFATWLDIELAVCEVQAELGLIPAEAAADIRARAHFTVARIAEIEQTTRHDVIAFTTAVAEQIGPAARYLHFGLTSSDVVDTANAILMRDACDLLLRRLDALAEALRVRACEHKHTVMIGRTHGVHAEPTTFGLVLALYYADLQRNRRRLQQARHTVAVGKLSGAVGTFAHLDPEVEARVCARLGLRPDPISTQVIQRDRHAELLLTLALIGAGLEKIALEVRHLQRTEVREAREAFGTGQKGSSAMPHKRNPIVSEQLCGLARVLRANAQAALENIALWHERDISHSSVERIILPDSCILTDYMLVKSTELITRLVVDADRMRANLDSLGGVTFSGGLLLTLVQRGLTREAAYALVQRLALRAWDEGRDFLTLASQDAELQQLLTPDELRRQCDLAYQLRHVDKLFQRVFEAPTGEAFPFGEDHCHQPGGPRGVDGEAELF